LEKNDIANKPEKYTFHENFVMKLIHPKIYKMPAYALVDVLKVTPFLVLLI